MDFFKLSNEHFADVSMIVGLSGVGIMILLVVLALVYFLVIKPRFLKKTSDDVETQ